MEISAALRFILTCLLLSLVPTTSSQSSATVSPSMPTSSNNQQPGNPSMSMSSGGSNLNPNTINTNNNPNTNAVYNQPQPGYQPVGYQPQDNYVPHATYPYAESFPNPGYDGYLVPAGPIGYSNNGGAQHGEYAMSGGTGTSLIPTAQVLAAALRLFAKVGLFLLGGVALLVVGGIFTTAVCSLTPICTITFTGLRGGIDQETVRALMTPEKIATAASFVNDAIGKYQRLQRSIVEY